MRISLIDVDSKIPNLALMKISAYHKHIGDIVGLNLSEPDQVYISCIFKKNKQQALGISKMFTCPVFIGGYGVNDNKLPDFIEHIMPDYSLYDCNYSLGFTTRGCIRNCSFCIVPIKEGKIRVNCDITEFWNHKHKHIVLMDNNILALPNHFKKISQQLIDNNLSVDFNQGLDIRLVTDDIAKIFSKMCIKPSLRFSFDDIKIEKQLRNGIKILKDNGCHRSLIFVLVGFDSTKEDDLKRLQIIKELDQRPYVMRFESCRGIHWYNNLAAWANQQQFFMSMDFDYFCERRDNRNIPLIKMDGMKQYGSEQEKNRV